MTYRLTGLAAVAACLLALPASAQTPEPLTCLLTPERTSDIGSDRTGIVRAVEVERADFVEKGAPLVRIDTQIAEADLRVARINIAALQERLGRSEGLLERNLISRDEIESMRTQLAIAMSDEARAQTEVDRAVIRAPFSGYVADIAVSVGELIGPQPLVRLIEVSTLRAEMVFLVGAFGEFAPGDVIKLRVDLTGSEVDAVVASIDPFLDAASNTFTVVARIDNQGLELPAGTSCRVVGG